jgi:hypothetical protein
MPFHMDLLSALANTTQNWDQYYDVGFVHKRDMSEHLLWAATQNISPDIMRESFGKEANQEELYCKITQQAVGASTLNAAKDKTISDMLKQTEVARDIENYRFVRLTMR